MGANWRVVYYDVYTTRWRSNNFVFINLKIHRKWFLWKRRQENGTRCDFVLMLYLFIHFFLFFSFTFISHLSYPNLFSDSSRKLQDVLQEFCAPESPQKFHPDGVCYCVEFICFICFSFRDRASERENLFYFRNALMVLCETHFPVLRHYNSVFILFGMVCVALLRLLTSCCDAEMRVDVRLRLK